MIEWGRCANVGSNEAWEQSLAAVKQAADNRPTKKATPPPADGTPPVKKRMTGQQSYGDIEGLFERVVEALELVLGYAPPATSQIQLTTLDTLQTDYRAANKGAAMTKAERARRALYDGMTDSLRTKMKAIKKATRAQYGASSAQFADVMSINL